MRVAVIDLGTNSTRLLVADVVDGELTEVARRLTITRLGEGVDATGRLAPAAVERVRACLAAFRDEIDRLGVERTLSFGTSAMRDASDGASTLEQLGREFDVETRLLTGDEEAELGLLGTTPGRTIGQRTLLVDIGGGSTELTLAGPDGVDHRESTQLGCVRLTERFLHADPPAQAELGTCAAHVRGSLPDIRPERAIGVAGTVTTAAAIDSGVEPYDPALTHGHLLAREAVGTILDRLAELPIAERERVPCLEPARAPVIVAGLVILREILDAYRLDEIEVSERDILHGVALAVAGELS
jgi:exopolyphosphatase/guanosine-5'-triphosphate,3'-diphosphate pyrophosphatase